MQQLNFTLTVEESNLILEALGQMPYVRVFPLIQKLQQQAGGQLAAAGDAPAAGNGRSMSVPPVAEGVVKE